LSLKALKAPKRRREAGKRENKRGRKKMIRKEELERRNID
jgi:hypothetical protein